MKECYMLFNRATGYPVRFLTHEPVTAPSGQRALEVRAESPRAAALEILEAAGFTLEPCREGECPACQLDAESAEEDRSDDRRAESEGWVDDFNRGQRER